MKEPTRERIEKLRTALRVVAENPDLRPYVDLWLEEERDLHAEIDRLGASVRSLRVRLGWHTRRANAVLEARIKAGLIRPVAEPEQQVLDGIAKRGGAKRHRDGQREIVVREAPRERMN